VNPNSPGRAGSAASGGATPNVATPEPSLATALGLVGGQNAFFNQISSRFPKHKAKADRLLRMNQAHQALLETVLSSEVSAPTKASELPVRSREVDSAIRSSLKAHHAKLHALALESDGGWTARALASISASVAQYAEHVGVAFPLKPTQAPNLDTSVTPTELDALQRALAYEHAALWWYGVLGGQTSASSDPGLFQAISAGYLAHRTQRDQLVAALTDGGESPVAANAAYPIRWRLNTPKQVASASRDIEQDCASTSAWLVSEGSSTRSWSTRALINAAIRELAVQGIPENFPGASELADR